jgi:hypothetical protein
MRQSPRGCMLGEFYDRLVAKALFTDGDTSWVMVGNEKTPMSGTPRGRRRQTRRCIETGGRGAELADFGRTPLTDPDNRNRGHGCPAVGAAHLTARRSPRRASLRRRPLTVLRSTSSEQDAWDGRRDRAGVYWRPDPGARAPTLRRTQVPSAPPSQTEHHAPRIQVPHRRYRHRQSKMHREPVSYGESKPHRRHHHRPSNMHRESKSHRRHRHRQSKMHREPVSYGESKPHRRHHHRPSNMHRESKSHRRHRHGPSNIHRESKSHRRHRHRQSNMHRESESPARSLSDPQESVSHQGHEP